MYQVSSGIGTVRDQSSYAAMKLTTNPNEKLNGLKFNHTKILFSLRLLNQHTILLVLTTLTKSLIMGTIVHSVVPMKMGLLTADSSQQTTVDVYIYNQSFRLHKWMYCHLSVPCAIEKVSQ